MGDKLVLFDYCTTCFTEDFISYYHAGSSGGHIDSYKTLFHLRLRLFWPTMRKEIKLWAKRCVYCVSYDIWRTRMSKLHSSWSATVPFWIMHVDLWSPGHISDDQGQKGYLMNSMCNISQFVISSPTAGIISVHLGQLFMSDVILAFEMRSVVLIDDSSSVK